METKNREFRTKENIDDFKRFDDKKNYLKNEDQRQYQEKQKTNLDREEYAVVLDFLPNGYPFDNTPSYLKKPIVQGIGKKNLLLLEMIPKPNVQLSILQDVYIGEEKRNEIHHVSGVISYDRLTPTAKNELPYAVEKIVKEREKDFVNFINNAKPLTTRMHSLELISGLGKKRMWELIEEREKEEFASFEDIQKRAKVPNLVEMITKRIIEELSEEQKHYLFVKKKKKTV